MTSHDHPSGHPRPGPQTRGMRIPPPGSQPGFTLLEVMIASGILFICLFSILAVLSSSLRNARALQNAPLDAAMLAAELSLTNKLAEGTESGSCGDLFPGYHWTRQVTEASSNGLFQVDFVITRSGGGGGRAESSHMSILLFRESPSPGRIRGR